MKMLRSFSSSRHALPILLLAFMPLMANIFIITGTFRCDPELHYSGLGMDISRGLLPGAACFIDPTVAYITQPLGYLGAQDWLHGIVPWWNSFSGVGMPLAAEMQTESFFLPFVLLLHFHSGWLAQKILFQILSGCFCYGLLLEFGLTRLAAFLGASLYGLNGSFILTEHAIIGAIMCLPLLLWGIEKTFHSDKAGLDTGCSMIVLAVLASIYAGFPEVAFFDGLLAACWAIFRFFCFTSPRKWLFLLKLGVSTLLGVAITAPLTIPFLIYLSNADIGAHGALLAHDTLSPAAAPLQMMPLFYGALGKPAPADLQVFFEDMWVRIGGWFGCAPVLLAIYALVPKGRITPERYVLTAWIALWEARYFGLPGVIPLINLIPGIASTDAIRFSTVSVELSMFVLTACGINDLQKQPAAKHWQIGVTLSAFAGCLILSIAPASHVLAAWFSAYPKLIISCAVYLSAMLAANLIIIILLFGRRNFTAPATLMIGGAVFLSILVELPGATAGHQDFEAIGKLQSMLGLQRFYTLGPFQPNYAAEYGLSSINYAQLPVPQNWSSYITSRLFPTADTITFGGGEPRQTAALLANLAAYKRIGVQYILAPPHTDPFDPSIFSPVAPVWSHSVALNAGDTVSGIIGQGLGPPLQTDRVSIQIGTYHGAATGPLVIRLCAANVCSSGHAFLDHAVDNGPLMVELETPISIAGNAPVSYTIIHVSGSRVVIWLAREQNGTQHVTGTVAVPKAVAPMLTFFQYQPKPSVKQIFADNQVAIFDLGNAAPYMSVPQPGCQIVILSRQAARANCSQPANLVRRELYFPGWHAWVDGQETPLIKAAPLFQQISLPAGASEIRFTYIPPYTHAACLLALLAVVAWIGLAFLSAKREINAPPIDHAR